MVTFEMTVEKQNIIGADRISLAADANDTISFRFHFDRSWRIFDSKAVIFRNSDKEYYIVEIKDNRATVPWEVLTKEGKIEISVVAFENETTLTTKSEEITVDKSLLPEECKTFSASETLFDRFKKECTAKAFLDYEDEIENLKSSYDEQLLKLGEKIVAVNQEKSDAIAKKNEEIDNLNYQHSVEINNYNRQISEINNTLAIASEKAEKWDLVNLAVSQKTVSSNPLWNGGTREFSLPMLNTSSMSTFSSNSFSANLINIGLDLSSTDSFESVFSQKKLIKNITLRNTHNVRLFNSAFDGCSNLRSITLGKISSCNSLYHFAAGCSSLEKIVFSDANKLVNLVSAFYGCSSLKEIDGELNMNFATDITSLFSNCYSLETVRFSNNSIRKSIDLRNSVNLSKESMLSLINGLCDEVSMSLYVSNHAFEDCFPTMSEQNEIYEIIMEEKGWAVGLY